METPSVLKSVDGMVRSEVVPFYAQLIVFGASDEEVKRVNNLILSKWESSGLLYIKNEAWKVANALGYSFEKGWRKF